MNSPPEVSAVRARAAFPRWRVVAAGVAGLLALATVLLLSRHGKPRPVGSAVSDAWGTVTADIADLRREPSAGAAPAGALPNGSRVAIVSDRGRWLEVRTGKGETGFVSAETVETDGERQTREERGKRILSFTPVSGVVAEDSDILLAPYPSAARAGRLRQGTAVPIYAVDHDYYAVRGSDGAIAFVHSSDVDLVPPDPRRPAIVPETGKAVKDVTVTDLAPASPPQSAWEPREGIGANPEDGESAPEEPLEPAALISKVDPEYPEAARRAGVEGTVVLDATISETGEVTHVAVERGLPLGASEAAVAAVERWKYRPAQGRAGPVASHKTIRIVFSLR